MIYWDRITLKSRAKAVLKNTYWMTFLALIIVGLLGGNTLISNDSAGGAGASVVGGSALFSGIFLPWYATPFEEYVIVTFFSSLLLWIGLFAAGYAVFVGSVMTVGRSRYLTMCRYGRVDLGELFFGFRNGRYWETVKTMFMVRLYTLLWSLLFIVPGVIKSFEYWMVPYILAENPGISRSRAFEISKAATHGEKWNMFVLRLSFLGWILLGYFAGCGIGALFVMPYCQATYAELYGALRYKAVINGLCSPNEIGKELFA